MRLIPLLACAFALCGCATESTSSGTEQRKATPSAAEVSAARGFAPAAVDTDKNSLDADARRDGYRVLTRNGQKVYCKSAAPLGTRLEKTTCLNAEQYKAEAEKAEADRQNLRRNTTTCGGQGMACGGGM